MYTIRLENHYLRKAVSVNFRYKTLFTLMNFSNMSIMGNSKMKMCNVLTKIRVVQQLILVYGGKDFQHSIEMEGLAPKQNW